MPKRIDRRPSPEIKKSNVAKGEAVEDHIHSLRQLASAVNKVMCHMMAFELRIRASVQELEAACQQAAFTDPHRTKRLSSPMEVAQSDRM